MIAFYEGMTKWIDEGRAMDIIYLDLSKASDTISHNTLIGKHKKGELDDWTVRCMVTGSTTEFRELWLVMQSPAGNL